MGMFDKDKSFGLDVTDAFPLNVPFALYAAEIGERDIPTKVGKARKSVLTVRKLDETGAPFGEVFEVTTLGSAIADKVEDAEPSDFPCKVELRRVQSGNFDTMALVLQWVGELNDPLDDVLPSDDATAGVRKRASGARA